MDPEDELPYYVGDPRLWQQFRPQGADGSHSSASKDRKAAVPSIILEGGKNAIGFLNELFSGMEYDQTSYDNEDGVRIFKTSTMVDGVVYTSEALSKKQSKLDCAEAAYRALSTGPNWLALMQAKYDRHNRALERKKDFWEKKNNPDGYNMSNAQPQWKTDQANKRAKLAAEGLRRPALAQNAVGRLNDFHIGLKYDLENKTNDMHNPDWHASVTVANATYTGQGTNKMEAKCNAAEQAMLALNIKFRDGTTPLDKKTGDTKKKNKGRGGGGWGRGGRGGKGRGGVNTGAVTSGLLNKLQSMATGGSATGFVKAGEAPENTNQQGGVGRGRGGRGRGRGGKGGRGGRGGGAKKTWNTGESWTSGGMLGSTTGTMYGAATDGSSAYSQTYGANPYNTQSNTTTTTASSSGVSGYSSYTAAGATDNTAATSYTDYSAFSQAYQSAYGGYDTSYGAYGTGANAQSAYSYGYGQ